MLPHRRKTFAFPLDQVSILRNSLLSMSQRHEASRVEGWFGDPYRKVFDDLGRQTRPEELPRPEETNTTVCTIKLSKGARKWLGEALLELVEHPDEYTEGLWKEAQAEGYAPDPTAMPEESPEEWPQYIGNMVFQAQRLRQIIIFEE